MPLIEISEGTLEAVVAALKNHLRCHSGPDGECDREDHDDAAEALRLLGYEPHQTQDEKDWHAGRVLGCEDERCRRAIRRAERQAAKASEALSEAD